ncbi:MAG: EAL domain-containing protein, partial [Cyanobacteria bacterium J06623_4]
KSTSTMTLAPWSAKETLRLAKLNDYGILDTLPDDTYDDIAAITAHICQTPTALVSLVDASRQWFKAKIGMEVSETPRSIAFCAHTIQQPDVMVVEDTHRHSKFCDNPLVTGPPYIRFYAGAPLLTPDGHALGSLCVIDYVPRPFTEAQRKTLQVLSRQVVAQMELSRQSLKLQQANETLEQRVEERTASLTRSLHRLLKTQTALLKREAASRHRALHDPLTGLPNRSYFLQRLDQAIQLTSRQPSHQYAVLFIDLDNFKPVNDTLGHDIGDRLLAHVAKQIKQLLRRSDLVARLGGDEFAVLLDSLSDEEQAITAVKRLQAKLNEPCEIDNHQIFISASIGITFSSLGYRQPESALRDADTAMYQAKEQAKKRVQAQLKAQLEGQLQQQCADQKSPILIQDEIPFSGQQFVVFNAEMKDRMEARLSFEDELRHAVLNDQLHLHYQPIFDLNTRQIYGLETLLRWNHPTKGYLPARDFITIAEDIGVIRQLCSRTIQLTCEQMVRWRKIQQENNGDFQPADKPLSPDQLPLKIHINLSLTQIRYPQLIVQWQAALKKYQLPASAFQLEVAESVLISGEPAITDTLQKLQQLGFGLCVDDFGRGHSSLSRLRQLEVNMLKIDRSFVSELNYEEGVDIVKTIVAFGQSAGMDVIAEGIETAAHMNQLTTLGCRRGQGLWLADALPSEDIDVLVAGESDR